jgi:hypothetical protein
METYRGRRAPRTARILTTARAWGEIWHVDNELLTHRDTGDYRYTDWLYGQAAQAGNGSLHAEVSG